MEINRENIFDILKETNIRPTKDSGQNFLVDVNAQNKIVNLLSINKNDDVLEIGPGLGSLTNHIKNYKSFTAVDIDSDIVTFLNLIYKNEDIILVENNIFNVDISHYSKIISNIPYNITSDLMEYILKNGTSCNKYVLMCQEEAVNRFIATQGSEYCPLSVYINLIGNIRKQFLVKKGAFVPQPKCTSAVFTIEVNKKYDNKTCYEIYLLTKKLFLNRRKTILNNLSSICDKSKAIDILNKLNIPINKRPEELTPKIYADIYFHLNNRY